MKIKRNIGKGSKEQVLPSRHALNTLVKGDPAQRTLNQYAKATPSGLGDDSPTILGTSPDA